MHKDSAECRKSHASRHLHSAQAVCWPTYDTSMRTQTDCPSDGNRWVLVIYTFSPASLGIQWHTAIVTMKWTLDYSFFVFLKSWMAPKEAEAMASPHSQHALTTWAKWPDDLLEETRISGTWRRENGMTSVYRDFLREKECSAFNYFVYS